MLVSMYCAFYIAVICDLRMLQGASNVMERVGITNLLLLVAVAGSFVN